MQSVTRMLLGGIREIIFGLEDGLVSTLGVVTGIASGTQDRSIVLLSGVVLVAVESLSMAAGTYLSNKSEQEAQGIGMAKRMLNRLINRKNPDSPVKDALTMGIAYVAGGLVPVVPYLFLPVTGAIVLSVAATLVTLLLVGIGKGRLTQTSPVRSGIEMMAVSITATAIGYGIGRLASFLFPQLRSGVI